MRGIIVFIVVCLLLVSWSCSSNVTFTDKRGNGETLPLSFWITPSNYKVAAVVEQFDDQEVVNKLYLFVTNLDYIADVDDFWQTPQETLQLGGGDCEDLSFLLASLLIASDIDGIYIATGFAKETVMVAGIGGGHMWVEWDNKAYETTFYVKPFDTVIMDNKFYIVDRILVR